MDDEAAPLDDRSDLTIADRADMLALGREMDAFREAMEQMDEGEPTFRALAALHRAWMVVTETTNRRLLELAGWPPTDPAE